jgi:Fibronectin type III domain/Divergent InlB B-repeat domain
MQGASRVVAAALAGAAGLGLVLAVLASGAGGRATSAVTLQVAPRGPGSVKADPPGRDGNGKRVSSCDRNEGQESCSWTYDQGTTVKLSPDPDDDRSFAGWSTPDCSDTGSCSVTLDTELTTVVALFNPLRLGVVLSNPDAGSVTADPSGEPCDHNPGAEACFEYPPHTRVQLTIKEHGDHAFKGWNGGCEPAESKSCTIVVEDDPTWAGARFDHDDAPPLATTIKVQFQVRKGGNGTGRVTASKLDCGTVCSAEYDYGKTLTLSAASDPGSTFDGWNGICARTQLTCRFPVGPITILRALFARDATPPTAPGGLVVQSATRTSISIAWTASTDNVGVTGYRAYVNDLPAGDVQASPFTLNNLVCSRSYTIGVDATDAHGNRSQRATIVAQTKPCAIAARVAGVGVHRVRLNRIVSVQLRVNRIASARLSLASRGRPVASGRYSVKPGMNTLGLRLPRKLAPGSYRLTITVVDPDGNRGLVFARNVLVRRLR